MTDTRTLVPLGMSNTRTWVLGFLRLARRHSPNITTSKNHHHHPPHHPCAISASFASTTAAIFLNTYLPTSHFLWPSSSSSLFQDV